MKRYIPFLLAFTALACGQGLTMPSPSEQSRIQEAVALLRASQDSLPFAAEPLGAWFAARVEGVYINDRHPEYDAYRERETGRVFVSREVAARDVRRLAATLLHEARHADGAHTCGLKDQTLEEWGPWAVQAWWLDGHGFAGDAADVRREWVCGR